MYLVAAHGEGDAVPHVHREGVREEGLGFDRLGSVLVPDIYIETGWPVLRRGRHDGKTGEGQGKGGE